MQAAAAKPSSMMYDDVGEIEKMLKAYCNPRACDFLVFVMKERRGIACLKGRIAS